jgi:hypothetical protein
MEIRVLGPGDDHVLARVALEVFDHEPLPTLTNEFLEDQETAMFTFDRDRLESS